MNKVHKFCSKFELKFLLSTVLLRDFCTLIVYFMHFEIITVNNLYDNNTNIFKQFHCWFIVNAG